MLCEDKMTYQKNTMSPSAKELMSERVNKHVIGEVVLADEQDRSELFTDRRRCKSRRVNDNAAHLKAANSCRRKKSSNRRRSFGLNKEWYLKTSYVDQGDTL